MSNVPSDSRLAAYPRPPNDNGRGVHYPLDARPSDFPRWAQAINALKFRWVTVYGQNENVVCDAALYIKQNCNGAVSILRAEASDAPGHRKAPDFFGMLAKKAIAMGLAPYIQIGNEPEAEWGSKSKWSRWWSAAAAACVAAGGYAGLQVLSEDYFAAVAAAMPAAILNSLFICAHGQAANHPPGYPYDARNQADHPGATAATDTTTMLIPLAFGEWFTKYLGNVVVPVIVTEGPWNIDGDGSGSGQGLDTRYPPISFESWADYIYATYEQFRTGVLANGQPLPDYWFAENYWLLYDGGGFMNNGMLGSWYAEKKQPLVDRLTNDALYVRQFSGPAVPPPEPPPPEPPPPQPPPTPGILSDIQLAHLVMDAGFSMQDVAIAVILAESGGNPLAKNSEGNTPPSTDRGLWQINDHWHPEVSDVCAFDAHCSTIAAFVISKGGADFTPWSAYNAGTYKKFLDRAEAALAATQIIVPRIDPRLRWLSYQQGKNYQLSEAWFYDSKPPDNPESEGNVNIYVVVQDSNGRGLQHEAVVQKWPDGSSTHYTRNGMTAHQQSGDSNFDPNKGQAGPYTMQIGDCAVNGLGLPLRQHCEYLLVIVKV